MTRTASLAQALQLITDPSTLSSKVVEVDGKFFHLSIDQPKETKASGNPTSAYAHMVVDCLTRAGGEIEQAIGRTISSSSRRRPEQWRGDYPRSFGQPILYLALTHTHALLPASAGSRSALPTTHTVPLCCRWPPLGRRVP